MFWQYILSQIERIYVNFSVNQPDYRWYLIISTTNKGVYTQSPHILFIISLFRLKISAKKVCLYRDIKLDVATPVMSGKASIFV